MARRFSVHPPNSRNPVHRDRRRGDAGRAIFADLRPVDIGDSGSVEVGR
jgi:hypothetical protein